MSTFRQMVYMVLDHNKLSGDDSYVEPEHVIYILSKIRAYLLTTKYKQLSSQVANSNFQTICVPLERIDDNISSCIDGQNFYIVRSTKKIPNLLELGSSNVTIIQPNGTFGTNLNYNFIGRNRFNSIVFNKWMRNQNYVTIGPDNYLYIKSPDENILLMDSITLNGVFEDIESASQLVCQECTDGEIIENDCDILDSNFPLEEGLVTSLLQTAIQFFTTMAVRSKDNTNNATDDLSNIERYLNSIIKERYRQYGEN